MKSILTLVSSDTDHPLLPLQIEHIAASLKLDIEEIQWLSPLKAADIYLPAPLSQSERKELEDLLLVEQVDHFVVENSPLRQKKLLIADMDNTIVIGETLDELADRAGVRDSVAEITEKAMHGLLDFPSALRERVRMLKGLSVEALGETLNEIDLMPGARELVATMVASGAVCVLVSGGFTCFTSPIAAKLGFQHNFGNVFEVENNRLTGRVTGQIIDHQSKLEYLVHFQKTLNLSPNEVLAVGDGANDVAMVGGAGLGVGYHPKPLLQQRASNNILYGNLATLLYAQGYAESEISCL